MDPSPAQEGMEDDPIQIIEESNRDPRIQRLLEDAKELQQRHREMMSTSPLRLKGESAERLRNASATSRNSPAGTREAIERARLTNYAHLAGLDPSHSRSRSRSQMDQS